MSLRQAGFWDEHYGVELRNYEENGDEGEIWFGKRLSKSIANWITQTYVTKIGGDRHLKILDVGCGNAYLLNNLTEKLMEKFSDQTVDVISLVGIDYSANSIELSKKIIADKQLDTKIHVEQCDFLNLDQVKRVLHGDMFDVVVDVGTYDAICLLANDTTSEPLEKIKLKYLESLYSLIKPGSVFILASCNYTEEELKTLFETECASRFDSRLIDRIATPMIKFGGKEGSQTTCLIMEFG